MLFYNFIIRIYFMLNNIKVFLKINLLQNLFANEVQYLQFKKYVNSIDFNLVFISVSANGFRKNFR